MTTAVSACPVVSVDRLRRKLAARLGQAKFDLWFKTTRLSLDGQRLRIAAPNRFVGDWITHHFLDELRAMADELIGEGAAAEVVIDADLAPPRIVHRAGPASTAVPLPNGATAAPKRDRALRHSLDEFIVGPSNDLAYTAARDLSEGAAHTPHILFIHGFCGLGKTHLLSGLCRRVHERLPAARLWYTTAEEFTNHYIHAVRHNKLSDFRRRARKLDLLAVDDVHFFSSKPSTQMEFLHTFDAMGQCGAKVVLASDAHPKQIQSIKDALVSRFMSGMVVRVDPPDVTTRVRLIAAFAARRGMRLIESAAEQLARQITGSVREIEGAVVKLSAMKALGGCGSGEVGHTMVDRLAEQASGSALRRPVRIEQIVQTVCAELHVDRQQVMGRSRHVRIVLARAMGRPNHSTMVTAAQRIAGQVRAKTPLPAGETELAPTYDRLIEHLQRVVHSASAS